MGLYDKRCDSIHFCRETVPIELEGGEDNGIIHDNEFLIYDTLNGVFPNKFHGYVRKLTNQMDFLGPKVAEAELFVFQVREASYPFTQTGYSGYFGMGPVQDFSQSTYNELTMARQLQAKGVTQNLIQSFYTCPPKDSAAGFVPKLQIGAFDKQKANIIGDVRKLISPFADTWAIQL